MVLSLYHSMKTNAKTLSQRRRLLILDAMLPLKQQARRKVSKSKRGSSNVVGIIFHSGWNRLN